MTTSSTDASHKVGLPIAMEPSSEPESSEVKWSSGDDVQSAQTGSPCPEYGGSAAGALVKRPAAWISKMLQSQFFVSCDTHKCQKKNECTYFCVSCAFKPHSLCQHCLTDHCGHKTIQIRRYVYCDVIRAVDINPFVDTSGVQCYIINQAKVMFLRHRPHTKMGKPGSSEVCQTCHRHLREGYQYCSLACKVDALHKACDAGCTDCWDAAEDVDSCCSEQDVDLFPAAKRAKLAAGYSSGEDSQEPLSSHLLKPLHRRKYFMPKRSPSV